MSKESNNQQQKEIPDGGAGINGANYMPNKPTTVSHQMLPPSNPSSHQISPIRPSVPVSISNDNNDINNNLMAASSYGNYPFQHQYSPNDFASMMMRNAATAGFHGPPSHMHASNMFPFQQVMNKYQDQAFGNTNLNNTKEKKTKPKTSQTINTSTYNANTTIDANISHSNVNDVNSATSTTTTTAAAITTATAVPTSTVSTTTNASSSTDTTSVTSKASNKSTKRRRNENTSSNVDRIDDSSDSILENNKIGESNKKPKIEEDNNKKKDQIVALSKSKESRERNRLSAKRSRQRKKMFLNTLIAKNRELEEENKSLRYQILQMAQQHDAYLSQLTRQPHGSSGMMLPHRLGLLPRPSSSNGKSRQGNPHFQNSMNSMMQDADYDQYRHLYGGDSRGKSNPDTGPYPTNLDPNPYLMQNNNNSSGMMVMPNASTMMMSHENIPSNNNERSQKSVPSTSSFAESTILRDEDFEFVRNVYQSEKAFLVSNATALNNPIIFASEQLYELLGYIEEEIVGKPFDILYGSESSAGTGAPNQTGNDIDITVVTITANRIQSTPQHVRQANTNDVNNPPAISKHWLDRKETTKINKYDGRTTYPFQVFGITTGGTTNKNFANFITKRLNKTNTFKRSAYHEISCLLIKSSAKISQAAN